MTILKLSLLTIRKIVGKLKAKGRSSGGVKVIKLKAGVPITANIFN